MNPDITCTLPSIENFWNTLNCVKATQSPSVNMRFKEEGLYLTCGSHSKDILVEGFIRKVEFDIYDLKHMRAVEIEIDQKVLQNSLQAIRGANMPSMTMMYPYRDGKVLLHMESATLSSQLLIDVYDPVATPKIELSDRKKGTIYVKDSKILKQAMEVCCYGKQDTQVFVRFDRELNSCFFIKIDTTTGIKSRERLPVCEFVENVIKENAENLYSEKVLGMVAAFPKAFEIQVKMYDEGVLEFCILLNENIWLKQFVFPIHSDSY